MKTAKDLELLLLVKEKKIQDLNLEIERLKEEYMILQNASDEIEEELQQRIDKAIEWLEDFNYEYIKMANYEEEYNEILDILKGVDKE